MFLAQMTQCQSWSIFLYQKWLLEPAWSRQCWLYAFALCCFGWWAAADQSLAATAGRSYTDYAQDTTFVGDTRMGVSTWTCTQFTSTSRTTNTINDKRRGSFDCTLLLWMVQSKEPRLLSLMVFVVLEVDVNWANAFSKPLRNSAGSTLALKTFTTPFAMFGRVRW